MKEQKQNEMIELGKLIEIAKHISENYHAGKLLQENKFTKIDLYCPNCFTVGDNGENNLVTFSFDTHDFHCENCADAFSPSDILRLTNEILKPISDLVSGWATILPYLMQEK
jgi:hypothetical protein